MGKKRFTRPKAAVLACAALMLALLLALGFWQVKRLAWKENLLASIAAQQSAPAVDFAALQQPWADHAHRKVTLAGRFLPLDDIAIGPRTWEGQAGHHLFTPFVADDGRIVFVNRGWSSVRKAAVPVGKIKIEGVIRLSEKPDFAPDNNSAGDDWYWPDLSAMAQARGIDTLPDAYVQLTAPAGGAEAPKPVVMTQSSIANNHLSYAVFWFGMAGVMLVIFALYHWREEKENGVGDNAGV